MLEKKFNDKISSIKVHDCKNPLIAANVLPKCNVVVTLFDNDKYTGLSQQFSVGNYSILTSFNDVTTSLKVHKGYVLEAFQGRKVHRNILVVYWGCG